MFSIGVHWRAGPSADLIGTFNLTPSRAPLPIDHVQLYDWSRAVSRAPSNRVDSDHRGSIWWAVARITPALMRQFIGGGTEIRRITHDKVPHPPPRRSLMTELRPGIGRLRSTRSLEDDELDARPAGFGGLRLSLRRLQVSGGMTSRRHHLTGKASSALRDFALGLALRTAHRGLVEADNGRANNRWATTFRGRDQGGTGIRPQ